MSDEIANLESLKKEINGYESVFDKVKMLTDKIWKGNRNQEDEKEPTCQIRSLAIATTV